MASLMDSWPAPWTNGQSHGLVASLMDKWPASWTHGQSSSTRPTWTNGQPHGLMACPMDQSHGLVPASWTNGQPHGHMASLYMLPKSLELRTLNPRLMPPPSTQAGRQPNRVARRTQFTCVAPQDLTVHRNFESSCQYSAGSTLALYCVRFPWVAT